MRKGYKVTLGVLTIMILLTLTIGTSYSYYSISDEQTNPNVITTTCFNVSYSEGSSSIALNTTGNYAYPMSEATALANLRPYTFTITNNCTSANAKSGVNYVVTLNTLTDTPSTLTSSLKYKLNTTGTTGKLTTPYALNANVKSSEGVDTSYQLHAGTLAPGASTTFNLYLWIDEAAGNSIMGQSFTGKVLVYSYM